MSSGMTIVTGGWPGLGTSLRRRRARVRFTPISTTRSLQIDASGLLVRDGAVGLPAALVVSGHGLGCRPIATNRPQGVGHAPVHTPNPAAAELRSSCDGDPSGPTGRRARPTRARRTEMQAYVEPRAWRPLAMAVRLPVGRQERGAVAAKPRGLNHGSRYADGPRLTSDRLDGGKPTGRNRRARPVGETTRAADGVSVRNAHGRWLRRRAPPGRLPDLTTDRSIRLTPSKGKASRRPARRGLRTALLNTRRHATDQACCVRSSGLLSAGTHKKSIPVTAMALASIHR